MLQLDVGRKFLLKMPLRAAAAGPLDVLVRLPTDLIQIYSCPRPAHPGLQHGH